MNGAEGKGMRGVKCRWHIWRISLTAWITYPPGSWNERWKMQEMRKVRMRTDTNRERGETLLLERMGNRKT